MPAGPDGVLPADSHVHSEWSWDAPYGSMVGSCERAQALGIPAIAFTEHVDHDAWRVAMDELEPDDHLARLSRDGLLHPPPFDAEGYLAAVAECRSHFPGLTILTGVELGEPHRHAQQVADVLATGDFDRRLGSLHALLDGDEYAEPPGLFQHRDAHDVMVDYLRETTALAGSDSPFDILAHIDYPVRSWPAAAGAFDPAAFEEDFREALRALAGSGRALELNTRVPLHHEILRWWRDVGGDAISFGSDAHTPEAVANGFADAVQLAEAHGFRAGRTAYDVWTLTAGQTVGSTPDSL